MNVATLCCMSRFRLWHYRVICFLLVSIFCASAQQEHSVQSVVVYCDNIVQTEVVGSVVPQPIRVESLSFESDVSFEQAEFLHLLGFVQGDHINQERVITACERFAKKNKFLTVKVAVTGCDNAVRLHFSFESAWTFKKIKIHNVYQGKHLFMQLYLMERGDVFDESKHKHSIVKIKEFLTNSGYLNHKVTSTLEYDHQTKEVIDHISIKKGKCFSFGGIDVEIVSDDGKDDQDDKLRKLMRKKLSNALSAQTFTKDQMNIQVRAIKDYLAKKGFLHSTIKVKEEIDYRRSLVNIQLIVTMYQKREIVFFGQRFFSKKQLLNKIFDFGQSVWLLPASLLAEEIVRAYKSKGFLNVQVTTQEEKERSFFVIKEGSRAVIKDVEIKNTTNIDQAVTKKQCFKKLLKNYS